MFLDVSLNLDNYVEPKTHVSSPRESIADIDFDNDELEPSTTLDSRTIIELAPEENINQWIEGVRIWMSSQKQIEFRLSEIVEGTKMPRSKVFLALLHGEFKLVQEGNFYQNEIVVIEGYQITSK